MIAGGLRRTCDITLLAHEAFLRGFSRRSGRSDLAWPLVPLLELAVAAAVALLLWVIIRRKNDQTKR